MSVSSRSGATGLERLPRFKYNVLKWDSAFTVRLNAANITDKIKKCFTSFGVSNKHLRRFRLTRFSPSVPQFVAIWKSRNSIFSSKLDLHEVLEQTLFNIQ